MRAKKGAFHLGLLLGKGFKNLTLALQRYWLLPDNPWGVGPGVEVTAEGDDETKAWKGTRVSRQEVLFNAGDSRAVPLANNQMQTPAEVGACTQCWQRGFRLDVCGCKGTYYLSAPSRLEAGRDKVRLLKECDESFAGAPADMRAILLAPMAPQLKKHSEVVKIGRAAEGDSRLHTNPKHKCKAGYHRRDALATHYNGVWDSARQFFTCTSHEVMNLMRNMFELMGVIGKAAFTGKRKRMENHLKRLEYMGASTKAAWETTQKQTAKKGKSSKKRYVLYFYYI